LLRGSGKDEVTRADDEPRWYDRDWGLLLGMMRMDEGWVAIGVEALVFSFLGWCLRFVVEMVRNASDLVI
jgi:hypothetical protein